MGKVIADLATSAASATFAVENATSSVDYVLSGTDGSANQILKTDGSGNLSWTADSGGLFASYAIIADQKSDTTAGGTFTTGAWRTRDLQTEIADSDGIVSIATNQFTLAAGSYLIEWSAPALNVSKHQSRLYDVTGTAVVEIGSSEFTPAPVIHSGGNVQNRSFGSARVSPSGSNAYRIEHNCSVTVATIGFGQAASLGGEQYTMVKIFKES